MRRWWCVPMMTLCLLLAGCGGGTGETESGVETVREAYQTMTGCEMTAEVAWDQAGSLWETSVQCTYVPEGETTVEVLAPESIAGIRAVFSGEDARLEYEDLCLGAGPLSSQDISPMACLPRLMSALRDGWLLEKNEENWDDIPCLRLTVDQTGKDGEKILSTIWLREDGGTPVRGEIAVDGEIILTAEFTSFAFYDIMNDQE